MLFLVIAINAIIILCRLAAELFQIIFIPILGLALKFHNQDLLFSFLARVFII